MPYRDEDEVLRERYRTLEGELSHMKESREVLAGLDAKEAKLREEMATLTRSIARSRRRTAPGERGPLLSNLSVATPCPARWEDMVGDERTRFCSGCRKDVHNISALDAAAAETLLREKSGGLCVRFYQRADGTVMTQDCSDGVRRKNNRKLAVIAAGAFGLTATAFGALATFTQRATTGATVDQRPIAITGEAMPLMGAPVPMPEPVTSPVPPQVTPSVQVPRPTHTLGRVSPAVQGPHKPTG